MLSVGLCVIYVYVNTEGVTHLDIDDDVVDVEDFVENVELL